MRKEQKVQAKWFILVAVAAVVLAPTTRATDPADAILGQWVSQEGDARFEFYKADGKYCGKVVWLKEPVYSAKDKEAGKPVRDRENPDESKRNEPLVGLTILKDFKYKGNNTWGEGSIYNPDNGKTYSARLRLDGENKLKVRGYIGVSLIGGTTTWTRYQPPAS